MDSVQSDPTKLGEILITVYGPSRDLYFSSQSEICTRTISLAADILVGARMR